MLSHVLHARDLRDESETMYFLGISQLVKEMDTMSKLKKIREVQLSVAMSSQESNSFILDRRLKANYLFNKI